jgi:hypothetical protein
MWSFFRSIFGKGRDISEPLAPEQWDPVLEALVLGRDRLYEYWRDSAIPNLGQVPMAHLWAKEASNPEGTKNIITAFYAIRSLGFVSNLKYVDSKYGHDFGDALGFSLYNSQRFRMCPDMGDFMEAAPGGEADLRECLADKLADALYDEGSPGSGFIRPFVLATTMDLDYLCCASTAEAFEDKINRDGIMKQRREFLPKMMALRKWTK